MPGRRSSVTIFAEVSGGQAVQSEAPRPIAPELARRLLEQLVEQAPEVRAAALIESSGTQLVASDDADWSSGNEALWRAAGSSARAAGTELHVATGDGEVFAIRGRGLTIVATTERFALASLTLCDLRAVLRGLEGVA